MYISNALLEGLKILGLDKSAIKRAASEKHLEEIFLSTLFLNYLIVLVIYVVGLLNGGYTFAGREINMPVFFGLLMIYPFVYNLAIYIKYGFFGCIAELLNKKKHVKPLVSVGFHTAIVYTVVLYIIALLSIFDAKYGLLLLAIFGFYFLYTMFVVISTVYEFSLHLTLIVLLVPIMILAIIALFLMITFPSLFPSMIGALLG